MEEHVADEQFFVCLLAFFIGAKLHLIEFSFDAGLVISELGFLKPFFCKFV